jgi:hypothetical protein
MMAGAGQERLSELRRELKELGLFGHPVPRTLYLIDLLLGSRAKLFYRVVRNLHGWVTQLRLSPAVQQTAARDRNLKPY